MRLTKLDIQFYGPHDEELGLMAMDASEPGYAAVAMGRGNCKSEAARRAALLFRMEPKYNDIADDIDAQAWDQLPLGADVVEDPEVLSVCCIIKIEVTDGEV